MPVEVVWLEIGNRSDVTLKYLHRMAHKATDFDDENAVNFSFF